jgi:phasin family protein
MPSDKSWPPNPWQNMSWPGGTMPGVEEFQKMLGDLKLPGAPGADALMRAHQRNLEALSAANRIALEGAQAVARRHMEIMQQTMAELTDTLKALAGGGGPQDKAAKQAELLKATYERAVANTREMGELIQKANGEALGALNSRVAEALDELRDLVKQTKG